MTAEIAILNKSAVVLAADSAVTIGNGGNAKIYNTVSKIFELSDCCPIAVMIYNRLDFMGLPFEVLFKEYRNLRRGKQLDQVSDFRDDFIEFLSNEVVTSDDDKSDNIYTLILTSLTKINSIYQFKLREHLSENRKFLPSKFNNILQKVVGLEITRLKKLKFARGFSTKVLNSDYEVAVETMANRFIETISINQTTMNKIKQYMGYVLSKRELSSMKSGIVIAGFGADEMCPTLSLFETDGFVDGRLKIINEKYIDIGRGGSSAEILGFAQDDMVQSFVNGVDPHYREYMAETIRSAINESANLVLAPLLNDKDKVTRVIGGLNENFNDLTKSYLEKSDKFIEKKFSNQVRDMVRAMPKQDLANLAESLIEITKLKRKVTRDRETVGGDVDVAVLSRSEGMVWVKRKHYFPTELNSRFFTRQTQQQGGN